MVARRRPPAGTPGRRWTNRAGTVTLTACHGAFMSTATLLLFILASAVAIVTPAPPCCWP